MGSGLTLTAIGAGAISASTFSANAFGPTKFDPDALMYIKYGVHVARATKKPPATTEAGFTVAGGRVAVSLILGKITTVIQTQACNLKWNANPTVGSSADISANLNISALAVGIMLDITGTFAGAVAQGLALPGQAGLVLVDAGTLDLIGDADNTGSIAWDLWYFPIDTGATVVAA